MIDDEIGIEDLNLSQRSSFGAYKESIAHQSQYQRSNNNQVAFELQRKTL